MRLLRFFSVIFFFFTAQAQLEAPIVQNFTNKVYGKNSNPEIYTIAQDKNDVIYAGTSNGVLIYNGKNWKFCGVKDGAHVMSLSCGKNGVIYVGTAGDFGYLQKNSKGQYRFHSLTKKHPVQEVVWRIHQLDKLTFFQTESTIYVYSEFKFLKTLKAKNSFHLSFVEDNTFFVRERGRGLLRYNDGKLVLANQGNIFQEEGLFCLFKDRNKKFRYFFRNDNGTHPIEHSIYGGIRLKDGNYALNTLTDGVYILNQHFELVAHYDQNKGLNDNDIKQIIQGSDGNLWLATNDGISFIEYHSDLSAYNTTHGLHGDIQDVFFHANKSYYAGSKGIFIKENGVIESLDFNGQAWEFLEHSGKIFVATSLGVFEIKGKEVSQRLAGNFNNIQTYNNGFILSGMNGVVLCSQQFKISQNLELPLNRTLKITIDEKRNEAWIGTLGSGLLRVKQDGTLDIYDNQFDGLNTAWTKVLKNSDGKLYFATKDGLHHFIYEEEVRKSLPDSLKFNPEFERGIFELLDGKSDAVYDMLNFRKQDLALINNALHFGMSEKHRSLCKGYDFGRINRIKTDSKGNLYICSSEGVFMIQKQAVSYQHILRLSLQSFSRNSTKLNLRNNQEFPFSKEKLIFQFQAPNYRSNDELLFRYKLTTEQEKWSSWNSKSTFEFEKLNEGFYIFSVQAKDSRGNLSETVNFNFYVLPPWYRTYWAYFVYVILLGISYYFVVKFSRKRLQKKNEELEFIVKERTQEIALQKEEIEEKHKEITDSINYAERIQTALMMSDEHWNAFAKEYFIFFRPRDIVSGDFYWAYHNDEYAVWAAADCTGHGVPGAFMSMLGIGFLNEIVIEGKNFYPSDILNLLRSKIIKALEQKGSSEERKDGMDITLCVWDKKNKQVLFSGAHNPLFLLTSNAEKAKSFGDEKMLEHNNRFLVTLSADKMPVGKFVNDNHSFSTKVIPLDTEDYFFSLSDGFQDQFGGPDGKKYMIKRLKQFFVQQQVKHLDEFNELLEHEFSSWLSEGKTEQVDDVCIVGVKLGN